MTIAISNVARVTDAEIADVTPYMPMAIRIMLAATINDTWKAYVEDGLDVLNDAHPGDSPERFWKYLTLQEVRT